MEIAGIIAVTLLAVLALFQLALAAGAPLGAAAWGGQHPGVLPTRLRVASGVAAAVVYPAIILITLASSGLVVADGLPLAGGTTMWVLTGFFAVGTLANAASRSRVERIWAPVSLALAVCCAVIAASQ
jgi:hypothetical protein